MTSKMTVRTSRRTVLGAGAGMLASLLGPRAGRAARPKRLLIFSTANGTSMPAWGASGSDTALQLGPILASLEDLKQDLLVVRGLDNRAALAGPMENGHYPSYHTLLTGVKMGPEYAPGEGGPHGGISVDQYLAGKIGTATPFNYMAVGVKIEANRCLGASGYAKQVTAEQNPDAALKKFFAAALPPDQAARLRAENKSVLDGVLAEFKSLGAQLGADDRAKLDAHATRVRGIEARLTATSTGSECRKPAISTQRDTPSVTKSMIDIATTALSCDLTRVVTLQVHGELCLETFTWLDGMTNSQHLLSHATTNSAEGQQYQRCLAWYASQFGYLVRALKAVREEPGTLLDNTMIVWLTTLGQSRDHKLRDLAMVIAGGGGFFRTGRFVDAGGRSTNDVLVSALNFMGLPDQSFGDPAFCGGPLAALRG